MQNKISLLSAGWDIHRIIQPLAKRICTRVRIKARWPESV